MIRLGMMLLIPLFFLGCSEPEVEVYGKPGAAEQIRDPGVGNLDPGEFSAFAGVATPAKTICASCHSATPIGGQKLSSNSDSQNRQILLAYIKAKSGGSCDASILSAKISSSTHGGGNQSGVMPESLINQWIDKEKACASGTGF